MKKIYTKKDLNDALVYYDKIKKHRHHGEHLLLLSGFVIGAVFTLVVVIIKEMIYASYYG